MISLVTPQEIAQQIADRAKAKRLFYNLSQQTLAARSGVSYGVIKKFERTGQISLQSLLKLALTLEALEEFNAVFKPTSSLQFISLNALLTENTRKRGRQ